MAGERLQLTPYERHVRRKSALWRDRSSWDTHWQEISKYLLPRAGRFDLYKKNKGDKRHNDIYDSTGTRALRVLAAGLMSGMTSPARPWFRLMTADPDMAERDEVRDWLHRVTNLMRLVFDRSNTYRSFHSIYEELAAFGTAADIIEPDFDNVIHHYPLTVGEYAVAVDRRGNVNTIAREFLMPVSAMVSTFGLERVSTTARMHWDNYNLDKELPVTHLVYPRSYDQRTPGKRDALNMPYASVYFESGNEEKANRGNALLRESGYREFPAVAPRWSVSGGDIYGNGPGMDVLGDLKQLQHDQKAKARGIDYQTDPPVQVPAAYKGHNVDLLPGGVSYVDTNSQMGGIRNALEVRFDLQYLLEDIQDVRTRINSGFYADLFLMLAQAGNRDMTAREVAERHEEKLLMLGPVLERLHNEMLSPIIDSTFARLVEAGILPPPPAALEGMDLKVEFVSLLAQAQKVVGLSAVDRLLGTVGSLAQLTPEIMDKINTDQVVDEYSNMLGVDPDLIVADAQVAIIRQQRQEAIAAQQDAEAMPQAAAAAKDLAAADTSGKNALTDTVRQLTGYTP